MQRHPQRQALPLHPPSERAIGAANDPVRGEEQAGADRVRERRHQCRAALETRESVLFDRERVEFRAEAKLSPGDGEAAWRLGSVLLSEGHTEEALRELQRSDKLRPQMIETLYDLGKALEQGNQLAAAEKAWLQLIKLGPYSPLAVSAHLELSQLYRREGRAAEADSELLQFREKSKTKPAN